MSWPRIATGKPGSIASKVYSRVRGGKQQQHYHQQRGDQHLDHHQHQPARQSDRRRGRGGGGLQHNLADYIHDRGKFRSLDTLSAPSSTSEGSLGSVTTNHYVPFHPRAGSSHHHHQQQEQPHAWSESSSGHLAHNTRPQKGSNINTLRSRSLYYPPLSAAGEWGGG